MQVENQPTVPLSNLQTTVLALVSKVRYFQIFYLSYSSVVLYGEVIRLNKRIISQFPFLWHMKEPWWYLLARLHPEVLCLWCLMDFWVWMCLWRLPQASRSMFLPCCCPGILLLVAITDGWIFWFLADHDQEFLKCHSSFLKINAIIEFLSAMFWSSYDWIG